MLSEKLSGLLTSASFLEKSILLREKSTMLSKLIDRFITTAENG